MKLYSSILFLTIAIIFLACTDDHKPKEINAKLPNIVYILADDLGYGDLSGFHSSSKINTRNIDQLVAQGMKFTDAHSGSAVCTPTRYGILTGRYAWRTSLKNGVTWTLSKHLIKPDRYTVAKLLKDKGYHTACIGKWHLGFDWEMISEKQADYAKPIKNSPNINGFDYFFGIKASLDIPPYFYIENDQITATKIDTIEKMDGKKFWRRGAIGDDFRHEEVLPTFAERAIKYIDERAEEDNPFFLYLPLPAPHTPILPTAPYQNKSNTNEYGDFVLMVDDMVGKVMRALEANGLTENTLIIFTSDNGCSPMANFEELKAVDHYPSAGRRGHKADIYEGGHRVPFVARWPAVIPAQTTSHETICLTDFMRTCAEIVDVSLPDNTAEDSYSILPILKGEKLENPLREATVHHSVSGRFAIRQGKWKLAFCPGSGGWSYPTPKQAKAENLPPLQLFDLEVDPAEENNLATQNPEKVKALTTLMEQYIDNGRSTPGAPQTNEGETPYIFE